MAISGLLFDGLWDEHARTAQIVVLVGGVDSPRRALLEEAHAEEDRNREDREDKRRRVGTGEVEVVELILYVERQGLGPATPRDVPGHDADRSELAQCPSRCQDDPVGHAPPDR